MSPDKRGGKEKRRKRGKTPKMVRFNVPNENPIPKPDTGDLRHERPSRIKNPPSDRRWRFSFRHWTQREYFGLGSVQTKWFAALLERLKDLSSKHLDYFVKDSSAKKAYRYHTINWDMSVMTRAQFEKLIPQEYRDEETDVFQFQLGMTKGRVVGFTDSESVFQVVLLDPAHNMQLGSHRGGKPGPTATKEL